MLSIRFSGKSRDNKISVIIEGFPKGYIFSLSILQQYIDRRKATLDVWSTTRRENDEINIGVGLKNIDGDKVQIIAQEIEFFVINQDIKRDENINICRPGHADYVSFLKYGCIHPGGGEFSGRMTVLLAIAGGLCYQYLEEKYKVNMLAYISSVGKIEGISYKQNNFNIESIDISNKNFIVSRDDKEKFIKEMKIAQMNGDTVGGSIECIATNVPAGLGGPNIHSLEGTISKYIFAIPGVKSIEFGQGIDFVNSYGSEVIDDFALDGEKVVLKNNYNGGINGGVSNGMPILIKVAVKPVSAIKQNVSLLEIFEDGQKKIATGKIDGRNDVCIVPRVVVLIESAVALAIMEKLC